MSILNKRKNAPLFAALFIMFGLSGCGLVDLRPIGFSPFPEKAETVLPAFNSAVGVRFETAMDQGETQKAFSVTCGGNAVKGDISWAANTLSFVPVEGWRPGLRYTLTLDGTIFASDGRDERASLRVPFFAVSVSDMPYLDAFSPADGTSTGTSPEEGAFLVLYFSRPMDRFSTEDALIIDGISERECFWSNDDTELKVLPKKALSPWTAYRWTLSVKALSRDGVPLAKEAGASFITDVDRLLPEVAEVSPLIKTGLSGPAAYRGWQKTGLSMENGLGSNQAVGIYFNKPMDESASRSIRFDPAIAGRSEWQTETWLVFIPDKDPEPETAYTLIVSSDAQDRSGLRLAKEFRLRFTPDISYLTVLSINTGGGEISFGQMDGTALPSILRMPDGITGLSIRFSRMFDIKGKTETVLRPRLESYFPATLPLAALRSAQWRLDDTLYLEWEGLKPGQAGEAHYYKLILPGGRGGISDGKGSYLQSDCAFLLEALQ